MKYRRERGDMIEVYKLLNNSYKIKTSPLKLSEQTHPHRGHQKKLSKPQAKTNVRQNFLSFRVVDNWNNLTSEIVCSPSIALFKARLDSFWKSKQFLFDE